MRISGAIGVASLTIVSLGLSLHCPSATASEEPSDLDRRHREFLEENAQLLSETEREIFLRLRQSYQRDAFIERFWRVRDPFPETARNEFRDRWSEAAEAVRLEYDDLTEDRARTMLLFGEPSRTVQVHCSALRSLDLWFFSDSHALRGEFAVLFVRRGASYRTWSPREGVHSLLLTAVSGADPQAAARIIDSSCLRSDDIFAALALAIDTEEVEREAELVPRPSSEWAEAFLSYSTDLPEDAEPLAASFRVDYPGRYQSRTVVQAILGVAPDAAVVGKAGDRQSLSFLVDGEVVLRDELFEHFRYRFDFPAGDETDTRGTIPIILQRYLRPGAYTLIVKLQDLNSNRFFRRIEEVEVPNLRLEEPVRVVANAADEEVFETLDLLSEANATVASTDDAITGEHSVILDAPSDRLLTGKLRVSARTTGDGIARVSFELDDKPIFSKTRPPYSVELDLGRAPMMHTLRAAAFNDAGRIVATDEILLNTGPHRFAVRLVEPQRGRRYRKSVRAVAEVEVPELERLDRVEFYLNETLIASVYQAPFVQPILIPPDLPLSYVRAVGVLKSGASAEDVVFVNSPNPIDEVQVDFVELYTSVLDNRGRPAGGLTKEDFVVLEDGKEQSVRRFELVRDLPIHAGILLDTSTSMTDRIHEAEEAAMHFFQLVLTPRDRVCLLTFNDEPQLTVRFTNSVEVLAGGLADLLPEAETALYDSLIFSLYYFSGIKGKRALILLSDGADSASRYSFDEALEFARRTGVAIYAIGLSIPTKEVDIRNKLSRLCRETGGSCFYIDRASELKAVYTRIERELRSQYLIAYQSNSPPSAHGYRQVELKVKQPGLKAKTMRGYYP